MGGLSYGAIFLIIDGTNCSPKAVLACRSVNLVFISFSVQSLDCRPNVEQFNHQCFERSAIICEPLDIEVKKPRICGRQILRDNVEAETGRLL
jgi:hypothetical protein